MTTFELTMTEAKKRFADTVDRVRFGERVVLTNHSKPRVALISVEDLEVLEYIEDQIDLQKVRERLATGDEGDDAEEFFRNLLGSPTKASR